MATTVRGIQNVSGVGCHLSSAIVILCYALVPLRNALIQISQCHEESLLHNHHDVTTAPEAAAVFELARLLKEMVDNGDSESSDTVVDPSRVFAAFEQDCNPYELGDATRAMAALLKRIRSLFQGHEENTYNNAEAIMRTRQYFQALYEHLLGGPQSMQQEIVGRRMVPSLEEESSRQNNDDTDSTFNGEKEEKAPTDGSPTTMKITRRKRKRVPMPCPFPIDGGTTVLEAMQEALTPKPVQGYNWNNNDAALDYEESKEPCPLEDNESQLRQEDATWTTTKQTTFCAPLPGFFFLHLRRFEYQQQLGRVEATNDTLNILPHIELEYHDEDRGSSVGIYTLVGGILHVEDNEIDKDDEEYEGGHYVAVCRNSESPSSSKDWYLVNDEKVSLLEETVVLDLLAGKPNDVSTSSHSTMRGVMLVYSLQQASKHDDETSQILQDFHESLSGLATTGGTVLPTVAVKTKQQWPPPHDLVGKRLRIRWAKGKLYPGKVISYNECTGKHCIEYDDGDVREYTLRKKTIQWEDDNDDAA